MRFSIGLGITGFGINAEVDGKPIKARRKLWPLSRRRLFGGEWQWSWVDGVPMSLMRERLRHRTGKFEIFAAGKPVCHAELELPFRKWRWKKWTWSYGDHRLFHRSVQRRLDSCAGMFGCPRYVLKIDNGRTVVAWWVDGNGLFRGIIRPKADNYLARVAFGIMLSIYVSEDPGDAGN